MSEGKDSVREIGKLFGLSEESIEVWKNWCVISNYQKDIFDNYKKISLFFFYDFYQRFFQPAPASLSQMINPWSFSLINFTKELKGSPALESEILTEVAGYGSQLGTIMDVLEIMERECGLEAKLKAEPDGEDTYKLFKLKHLMAKINNAKKIRNEPCP